MMTGWNFGEMLVVPVFLVVGVSIAVGYFIGGMHAQTKEEKMSQVVCFAQNTDSFRTAHFDFERRLVHYEDADGRLLQAHRLIHGSKGEGATRDKWFQMHDSSLISFDLEYTEGSIFDTNGGTINMVCTWSDDL